MSYLALARKWRPRSFSQLVGQEHVSKALMNSLELQRLHHAYLFTGTRGVGKTSVARLLAKALNCEKGIHPEPCLECETCLAIEQGRFMDLIEVDAASRTGVEDTRALLENIQYAAANGRFKIYLIDEVHMLSQHSFNALLKTLEEPPAHVKFLLATTDPQKLPPTVLSRCLQFHLRHVPPELISKHLQYVLDNENIAYEEPALHILAQAARGSLRDSLSLLDQAIVGCDANIQVQTIKSLLGYTQQDYAFEALQYLAAKDVSHLLALSANIAAEGGQFKYVLDEILQYLHQMAVFQSLQGSDSLFPSSLAIQNLAAQYSPEDIQLFYQIALKGAEEIELAPAVQIGFEMTLLRMLTFRPAPIVTQPPLVLPAVEKQSPEPSLENPIAIEEIPEPQKQPIFEEALMEETITSVASLSWTEILAKLALRGLAQNAAENAELISKEGGHITLRTDKGHRSLYTSAVIRRIEEALSNFYQQKITLVLITDNAVTSSPALQKQRVQEKSRESAEEALAKDPLFQKIQQDFSAKIIKNSIVPLEDDL